MKSIRSLRLVVYSCVLTFAFSFVLNAQMPTGSVVGNAYDQTGSTIVGAKVTLRNVATGESQTSVTNEEGYYEFVLLRPANYEIQAEVKGFRRLHRSAIVVNVGGVVRSDLHFEIGEVSQTVEVSSETPVIEPDRTSISRSLDVKAVTNLPMLGRNILDLALTAPGTIPGAPGTQVVAFSVAGMRSQSNNYTLDGVSNNDPQVNGPLNLFHLTDAIQEFNVQTSIANTDVGRNSGAQVSIITKSGTNSLHGTLFYTGRNDALDANDFFLNRAGQKKNALRRHQFGGTAGGRLIRDKTFWFFSYEGFRDKTQQPLNARVPTAAERASVTDPVSQKVLAFYPDANTPLVGGVNWTGTANTANNNDTYFWRVDHNLTANHHLTARYAWLRGDSDQVQSLTFPFHGNITNKPGQHSMIVQENWARAKFINEAHAAFSRNRTFFQPTDVSLNPASIFTDSSGNPLPGYVNTSTDSLDGGLPNISITGFAGLGAGTNMPQGRATNTIEAYDNLSLISPHGWSRHTFKFGGGLRHEQTNRFLNGNYRGAISFGNFATALDASGHCVDSKGKPTSCFTKGIPQRGSLRTGVGGTFRTWNRYVWSYYAQDSFKAKSNLTINYGLRWEYFGQAREKHDRGSNFVPGIGMMALNSNLRIDIDPNKLGRDAITLTPVNFFLPRSGQASADYNNYAPFVGIAWSPKILPWAFGDGKTVIRTGFRLNYDDIFANIPVNMGLNLPLVLSTTLPTATYTWATALNQNRKLFSADATVPGGSRGIVTFNAWDLNARTAYAMNYALEVERQLGVNYSVGISYVGSQGRKLGDFIDGNEPTVTAVVDPTKRGDQAPNQRTFPFLQYAAIFDGVFTSNSTYNGMVATFRKRAVHGFSYSTSYTFGRAMDDNSSFFGSDGEFGSYADPRNRRAERGRSSFDVAHRVVATYIYELPFGPRRRWLGGLHGVMGHVVGGWDTAGIFNYRTGFPFTIFAGTSFDYSGLNQFADRPNFAPGVTNVTIDYSNPNNVFNCHNAAGGGCPLFTAPIAGTTGNVGRNRFIGPPLTNLDFAMIKNFPFGEGHRFQFRVDLFNAFNHVNFNLPSANLQFSGGVPTSSTAGSITSDSNANPRLIQLGLRLDW